MTIKIKSYNLFAILLTTFVVVSTIFYLTIKNNRLKFNEASFINKITANVSSINLDNLSPLEKEVWDKFQKIPENEYSSRYEEIAENNRVLLNIHSKENIGAYILKQVLINGNLSPKAELFILNKLRVLDGISGNIVNSIKLTIEYFNLAEELDSEVDATRAQIGLASIFNGLGGYNTAIKILQDLNIENKNFPEKEKTTISIYLHLAENFSFLNNTQESFKYLNKITPLLKNQPENYKKNVLILKNLFETKLYLIQNNRESALESLNTATYLLKNLDKIFFTDLYNLHLMISESYYLKYDKKKFSPNTLKKFIETSDKNGNIVFLKMAFKLLFQYYYEIEDFEEYTKLVQNYNDYLERITIANNKVFSMYLIENLEHEQFSKENEKLYRNIALLLLSVFFILIFAYKRILYLDKKAKVDTLTNIGNRLAFNEKLKSLKSTEYSMLLFDIDNFKKINDTFGHEFGDDVLSTIGKILKTIENKEISIYRVGGEEFIILFAHFNNEIFPIESCEFIRKSIENIHWKHPITVTISGGFSKATENVYSKCDERLYKAKNSGKNLIIYQDINEGDVK